MPHVSIGSGIVLTLLVGVFAVRSAISQTVDSASLATRIASQYPALPFVGAARQYLISLLKSGESTASAELLTFMKSRRRADSAWLSPREELTVRAVIGDIYLARDTINLSKLLTASADTRAEQVYRDKLFSTARALLASDFQQGEDAIDAAGATDEERRFINLLTNHLTLSGFHARLQLNSRVDQFVRDFPGSHLGRIAQSFFVRTYSVSDFGGAFVASIAGGAFTGSLSRQFSSFYGPQFSGELFIGRMTISASLLAGVVSVPDSFRAAGVQWISGNGSNLLGTLDAGYEFRYEPFLVTPVAGIAIQSIRSPDVSEPPPADLPRTNVRVGADVGVILSRRYTADTGPNFDVRARFGLTYTLLSLYDPAFSGATYYLTIGFALVKRELQSE